MSGGVDYYRCSGCGARYNDYTDFREHSEKCPEVLSMANSTKWTSSDISNVVGAPVHYAPQYLSEVISFVNALSEINESKLSASTKEITLKTLIKEYANNLTKDKTNGI